MKISIPTALSNREVEVLRFLSRGKKVVEFGSLLGFSTIQLAEVAKVVSVDKHEGYGPSTFSQFISNLDRFGVRSHVDVIKSSVFECDRLRADLGFIDLDGSAATTLEAIRKVDAPLILIHDLNRVRCSGVEVAIRKSNLEVVSHVDSLAVCRRLGPGL